MINANNYPTAAAAWRAALKAYRRIEHEPGACVTIINSPWTPTGELTLRKPAEGGSWGG
jgi:hypothetical protein